MSECLRLAPMSVTDARAWIDHHHSHLGPPLGGLFAVGVEASTDGASWRIVCAAVAGRPVARALQALGYVAEVSRVASDRTPHCASMAIAALARAALALGYRRVVSYTLLGESGTCYRAAGWRPTAVTDVSDGWLSHPRATAGSVAQPSRKVRWETGSSAEPLCEEAQRLILEHAGSELRARPLAPMPLFDALEAP